MPRFPFFHLDFLCSTAFLRWSSLLRGVAAEPALGGFQRLGEGSRASGQRGGPVGKNLRKHGKTHISIFWGGLHCPSYEMIRNEPQILLNQGIPFKTQKPWIDVFSKRMNIGIPFPGAAHSSRPPCFQWTMSPERRAVSPHRRPGCEVDEKSLGV